MKNCVLIMLASISLLSVQPALRAENIEQQVAQAIKERNHEWLGNLLKDRLGVSITLATVEKLAKDHHSLTILHALQATRTLRDVEAERKRLGISRGEFFQMALFIEARLPGKVHTGEYFFPRTKTHFTSSIEYDPQTKQVFLLLDDASNTFIGEGAAKIVTKAIHYGRDRTEIVARAEERDARENEILITKALMGSPGIFDIKGCTTHKKGSHDYSSIYSKMYNHGSLRQAYDDEFKFSEAEKEKIALSLLQGLNELHKRKIVHRDLSARNYLIDISSGKPNQRTIDAAVADLGRAMYAKFAAKTKVQGNTSYTSPEAVIKSKMRGSDYFASDVYALGLVFYQLFYEKRAKWQDSFFVKDKTLPEKARSKMLIKRINKYTQKRREYLAAKKRQNKLTKTEDFEYLILKMVSPNPKKRGTTLENLQEMERIIKR